MKNELSCFVSHHKFYLKSLLNALLTINLQDINYSAWQSKHKIESGVTKNARRRQMQINFIKILLIEVVIVKESRPCDIVIQLIRHRPLYIGYTYFYPPLSFGDLIDLEPNLVWYHDRITFLSAFSIRIRRLNPNCRDKIDSKSINFNWKEIKIDQKCQNKLTFWI